jgi:hypothetical protein
MIRYRVEWDPIVDAQFINAWIAAESDLRRQLTEIGNWIDGELAVDPETKGEYQSDFEVRTLAVPVQSAARVSVAYRVFADDRVVRVVQLTFKAMH